jgi:hypothetical protein
MPQQLLSLSNDIPLLINHNNALVTAGFIVKSPRDITQAPTLLAREKFFAVIVGNSVPPPVRQFIIHALKQRAPEVPVLFATVVRGEHEPAADQSVDISEDFGPLISALEALRSKRDGTGTR